MIENRYFISPYIYPGMIANYITANDIIESVCLWYKITVEKVMEVSRKKVVCEARQVIMFIIRLRLKFVLTDIGKLFNKDHTTVIHSLQAVQKMLDTNYLPADHIIYKYIKNKN